jgi:hypothetical protein
VCQRRCRRERREADDGEADQPPEGVLQPHVDPFVVGADESRSHGRWHLSRFVGACSEDVHHAFRSARPEAL